MTSPGPWKAVCRDVRNPENKLPWDEDEFLQWNLEGPRVPPGRGEFYADDVFIIAAAPEMYAALKAIAEASSLSEDIIEQMTAAINKAEGKTHD